MNTHSTETTSRDISQRTRPIASPGRPAKHRYPAGLGRGVIMGFFLAMFTLVGIADLSAGGINGRYRFVRGSGVIKAGGETITITREMAAGFVARTSGYAVVKNGRLKLHINSAKQFISQVTAHTGITAKVKGPKSIRMKKRAKSYVSSTKSPVVLTLGGNYEGQKFSGLVRYKFNAKIKNGKLTIRVPISGNILGERATGHMNIVCQR